MEILQTREATKEELNFWETCHNLSEKKPETLLNNKAIKEVAKFKVRNTEDILDRLYAAIALLQTEPTSARKSLYMACFSDFENELCGDEVGFIEQDIQENIISTGEVRKETLRYPLVDVDIEAIQGLPDPIPSHDVRDAFRCSYTTVIRFLQAYDVKRIKVGRKSFYDKHELMKAILDNKTQYFWHVRG